MLIFAPAPLSPTVQGVYQTVILRGITIWSNKASNQAYPGFVVSG